MSKYPIAFGRHLLLERINVGGMAEVFKAKAFGVEGFERVVAVKRILPTLVTDDEFITMFIDEARIAAHLTHQNIVQIYELGKHEETFFISMEYVAGKDLRQMLDFQKKLKVPMSVPKACFIVSRVCEALEYAHKKKDPAGRDLKIIHRDVTPQNIIISYEGEVKLCDFGIAKAASRVSRTQVGVLKGKFAYMSPEQVRGQPTDRRSDLFALGVIFYEMLTGERLFLADSDYTTLENVRNAVIPAPRSKNPQISEELEAVMLKLLAADPRDRFQWAAEVHEELLDHLVQNSRLYHGRHLRKGMQETYGRDIEIENEKLEAFMRLKMPPEDEPEAPAPSNVVRALAEEGANAARDPALAVPSDPDDDLGGPTDSFPIPTEPYSGDDETDGGGSISDAAMPTLAGMSPVANLFGAPDLDEVDERDAALTDGAMVVVASGSDQRAQVERPPSASGAERTQFDVVPGIPANDTLFDDGNDTVMGDGAQEEIDAAQAELLDRLGQVGALDDGQTIDASEVSEEIIAPRVMDPAESEEEAPTFMGNDFAPARRSVDDSATNVAPLILDDVRPEDAVALLDDDELFESDDGTLEDAEAFIPTNAGVEDDTSDLDVELLAAARGAPPAVRHEPVQIRPAERKKGARPPSPPPGMIGPGPGAASASFVGPPAPEPAAAAPSRAVVVTPQGGRLSRPRLLMILAGGVGVLAATLLAIVVLALRPSSASLQIVTEPTRHVLVSIDGKLVAEETPVDIDDLTVGTHQVELRAEGFRTYRQTIEIGEAKPHTMVVPLERGGLPGDDEEDDAPSMPEGDAAAHPEGAAPDVAEEDAAAPDEAPMALADDAEEDPRERVAMVGPTRPAVPPPPPVKARPPTPKAPEGDSKRAVRRPPPTGTLMVSTRPPGVSVLIDGEDTGRRTPIRKPYALPVGKHVITFVMNDGRRYDFDVWIDRGRNTKLLKLLR